jgi:hypothetical protein
MHAAGTGEKSALSALETEYTHLGVEDGGYHRKQALSAISDEVEPDGRENGDPVPLDRIFR